MKYTGLVYRCSIQMKNTGIVYGCSIQMKYTGIVHGALCLGVLTTCLQVRTVYTWGNQHYNAQYNLLSTFCFSFFGLVYVFVRFG